MRFRLPASAKADAAESVGHVARARGRPRGAHMRGRPRGARAMSATWRACARSATWSMRARSGSSRAPQIRRRCGPRRDRLTPAPPRSDERLVYSFAAASLSSPCSGFASSPTTRGRRRPRGSRVPHRPCDVSARARPLGGVARASARSPRPLPPRVPATPLQPPCNLPATYLQPPCNPPVTSLQPPVSTCSELPRRHREGARTKHRCAALSFGPRLLTRLQVLGSNN